ncbi:Death domain-associated protein 6 [Geodia barretti]|uniref:Death domain-associated protein 6 n=1 Tax=Geodia barretti TaxID=519541 RepID=A0AA35T0B5_GEOBA|nr:Death domain-associated protein 6 [Geodia barretti]
MMATNRCPEVLEVLGSSSEDAPSTETPGVSSLNATALRERRQRKKLRLKKLEKRLEILDRQIKKCAEAELSLDEMNSGYSTYIKEDLLKRKFIKTWQELCELQHVSDSIVIEDREGYEGTPYPEVNRRVQRLLRLDEFPDYLDIVQLLERCNSKHSLRIGTEEKGQLARKVFKDVGKIMKRSRHRDFVHHFGSHLTDTFSTASDPAEQDEALLKTLQESLREGEKKMQAVVEEFAVRQEKLQETSGQQSLEGDSCSANEEEDEEDEEEGKEGDGRFV